VLYDPKWEVKSEPVVKTDPFSLDGFIAWLETKPADGAYEWGDIFNCLMAQYFKARGFKVFSCGGSTFTSREGWFIKRLVTRTVLPSFTYTAATRPHTFGAALERARKVQS
jgi:hypothetical protein